MNDGMVIGIILFGAVAVTAFIVAFIPAPNATDISTENEENP